MNNHRLHRTVAAALAACTTLVLFSAVVSIAPPQERGELLARTAAPDAGQARALAQAPAHVPTQVPAQVSLLAFNAE